jgi:protein-tyrosine phosphatase
MKDAYPRRLVLEGAVNFRDLGGYPAADGRRTRWRRVFRADNLGALTGADLLRLAEIDFAGLIDFRIDAERQAHPDRLPEGARTRRLELGFLPQGTLEMLARVREGAITVAEIETEVRAHYRRFVTDHAEIFRRTIMFATDAAHYPLLLHCTSGKDRTGFAAALLLRAVGAPREVVEQDYLLTNQYVRDVSHLFGPKTPREVIDWLLSARAGYIAAALAEIDERYGSFDAYLANGLEIEPATRARLVELMTEAA